VDFTGLLLGYDKMLLIMKDPEQPSLPDHSEASRSEEELIWLKANCHKFLYLAREYYYPQLGRGALVITEPTDEPLDESTVINYAPLERISSQEDETSQRLRRLVEDYRPRDQFVAVFVEPKDQVDVSMYQIKVSEEIVKLVDATILARREEQLAERIALVGHKLEASNRNGVGNNGVNGCHDRAGG
jgi:hypothetical protein